MKPEDFEQRLQRLPMRLIPKEWRDEILAAVPASAAVPRRAWLSILTQQLSTLLWPCPKAWAGLASVWLLAWIFNFGTRDQSHTTLAQGTLDSPQLIQALREQRQLLVELVGNPGTRDKDQPKAAVPSPRSEGIIPRPMA
jgi:hypothetical protein